MNRMMRRGQRGSAMLVTMIVTLALLAGAVVLVQMQKTSNRGTDLTRVSLTALHCAEGGLAAARQLVAQNYTGWNAAIAASALDTSIASQPTWLDSAALDHDLDDDGTDDFYIILKDNDDETSTANDLTKDNDLRVFIVSTCTKFLPDTPKQISELVTYTGSGQAYENQKNGAGGNNNRQ